MPGNSNYNDSNFGMDDYELIEGYGIIETGVDEDDINYEAKNGYMRDTGCYILRINDTYGDGMNNNEGNHGWFNLYVNGTLITLGNQSFDWYYTEVEFGSRLFYQLNFDLDATYEGSSTIPSIDADVFGNNGGSGGDSGTSNEIQITLFDYWLSFNICIKKFHKLWMY